MSTPSPLSSRFSLFRRWPALLGMGDQVVVSGTSFLVTLLMGRFTSPEELGQYTLGFTLLVLLTCLFESVLTIPYSVHRNRDAQPRQLAGSLLVFQASLTVLGMLFLLSVAGAFALGGQLQLARVIGLLTGTAPFVLLRETARRFAFAEHEPAIALCVDVATAILQVGLLIGTIGLGVLTALSAHLILGVACGVVSLVWLSLLHGRFTIARPRLESDARRAWAFGRWVVAAQAVSVVSGYSIHWLLLLFCSDGAATGTFAACLTILLLANPFLLGMNHTLGPRAALAHSQDGLRGVRRVVRQGVLLYAGVMAVFCSVVFVFAGPLLHLFYADQFVGQEPVIRLLALAIFVSAVGMAMDPGLRALERADLSFRSSLIGLIATCVPSVFLIPSAGLVGGALCYLIGSCASTLTRALMLLHLLNASRPASAVGEKGDGP